MFHTSLARGDVARIARDEEGLDAALEICRARALSLSMLPVYAFDVAIIQEILFALGVRSQTQQVNCGEAAMSIFQTWKSKPF